MSEHFDWLAPSPLWRPGGLDFRQTDFYRPTVLEFASDDFMDDFLAVTASKQPGAFANVVAKPPAADQPMKLYQPVHGRFYLVCGSLCCRSPGFPDREIRRDDGESVFFVLRRLVNGVEYSWLGGGSRPGWKAVDGDARRVLDGEDRRPLSAATAADGRSLFSGYLPVASLDTYSVPAEELSVGGSVLDTRIEELGSRFIDPLSGPTVLHNVNDAGTRLSISVYLLLDLWEYFNTYLPDVAAALRDNPSATFSGDQAQAKADLMDFLKARVLKPTLTLAAALGQAATHRTTLDQTGGVGASDLGGLHFDANYDLQGVTIDGNGLMGKVSAALPPGRPPVKLPKFDSRADTRYVLRCVYERPQCNPPMQVVGLPSQPFVLARFFDPDAPFRPVRIPLPSDMSIAGLRKFKKGVTFMMSSAVRRKMEGIMGNVKGLIKDDPPSFSEGSGDFAFICSFSIQIIFIVAFVLLLMFVVILNFVFFWMAFFKICLPVPKSLLPE